MTSDPGPPQVPIGAAAVAAAGAGGRRAATDAEARALASSVRLRILRECYDEQLTNKQLADRLGLDPGSTLHHIRTLVSTGFLEPLATRPGPRGSRERPYRATGKSWWLDNDMSPGVADAMLDAFLAEVRDVDATTVANWMRLAMRLTRDDLEAMSKELSELLERYRERESAEGEPWAAFIAMYPRRTAD